MNKDNKLIKFVSLVLLVTIIALILVAGTYAKYTSTAEGSATAVVAKWDIKAGKKGEVLTSLTEGTLTFDLFSTINDESTGTAETDVTARKIAPGTKGEFEIAIQNNSEVTTQYAIDFTVTKGDSVRDANILFSTNDGSTWTSDLTDITESEATKIAKEGGETSVKVMWMWAYETTDGDAVDTTVGTNANAATDAALKTITVKAELTASQVD